METLRDLTKSFWSEKFWLPANITWQDIEPGSHGVNHANFYDLAWPIPLSVLIIFLRCILDKVCFKPVGRSLGIKDKRDSAPEPNKYLEETYRRNSKLNHSVILKLSKQLDWSDREVERWWRRRRAQDKTTTLDKFTETTWKCLFYLFNFALGMTVLWDEPYLFSIFDCAYGYPHHAISNGVWCYYMTSLAFYWSLTFTHFTSNKRKDFWQMFIHHVLALLLIFLSWICNLHRIGSLVLVVHDCADIFLEAAKSLNYARLRKACDSVFALFAVVWVISRLIILPGIIYNCVFRNPMDRYPALFVFNSMLVGLMILHMIWTKMIFEVIKKSLQSGAVDDVRSSSEDDLSVDEREISEKQTNNYGVIETKSDKNSRL